MQNDNSKFKIIFIVLLVVFLIVIIIFYTLTGKDSGKINPISSFFFGSKSNESVSTGRINITPTITNRGGIQENESTSNNQTNQPTSQQGNQVTHPTSSGQTSQLANQPTQSAIRNSQLLNNQFVPSPTQSPIAQAQTQADMLTSFLGLFLNIQLPSSSPSFPSSILNPQPSTLYPLPSISKGNWKKTGVFILSNYSVGAQAIVKSKSPILKVMDPHAISSIMQAVKDYKASNPSGTVVFRIYPSGAKKYAVTDNPTASAQQFFNSVIQPALNSLGENLRYFDYLETPNEFDSTPGLENPTNATWLSQFWSTLIDLNASKGVRTCVGSISVGNPGDIKNSMNAFLPALKKAKQSGGALCYHAYTLSYTTDVNQELNTSLRYRQIHDAIAGLDGSLASLPIILSEAGVDQNGNAQTSGWLARGSQTQYLNWLRWFDNEISKDSYVLGATLFQIGDTSWSSFNLEPIAGYLKN